MLTVLLLDDDDLMFAMVLSSSSRDTQATLCEPKTATHDGKLILKPTTASESNHAEKVLEKIQ